MANQIIERVSTEVIRRWQPLSTREKKLILTLGTLLLGLLYYFIFIAPAQQGIERAKHNLVRERQTLSDMKSQAQALNAQQLQHMSVVTDPQQIKTLLTTLAQSHGMTGIDVTNIGDAQHSRWQLSGKQVAFSDWIALLEELHQRTRLEVEVLTATRALEPGQVNLIVELKG